MSDKWIAQFKESDYGYEYSAVKSSNKHGQISWGWPGDNKMIFFGSGIGETSLKSKKHARKLVRLFTTVLNELKEF